MLYSFSMATVSISKINELTDDVGVNFHYQKKAVRKAALIMKQEQFEFERFFMLKAELL